MEAIDIIYEFVKGLQPDIIAKQEAKGLTASGASAESLRTDQIDERTVQLIDGSGSFQFQDSPGRGPTTGGASDIPLHKRIYDWLLYKKYGLEWFNEADRESLSYAIANKIHKKGNYIHIKGKRTGVVRDVITDQRLTLLREQIAKFYATTEFKKYVRAFKN
jgi:hypothetical protein